MILLLPLDRFRVDYHVAKGKHYSAFDALLLKAIAEKQPVSLEGLKYLFYLPPRLLIEIISNLVRAGWVGVSIQQNETMPSEQFCLTPLGASVLAEQTLPQTIHIKEEVNFIIMEKFSGSLINNRDIIFRSSRQLDKYMGFSHKVQPSNLLERDLDEGQIQQLLPLILHRQQNEWLHAIHKPVLTSADYFWLPVDVDLEKDHVFGLPGAWENHLNDPLLLIAHELAKENENAFVDKFYYKKQDFTPKPRRDFLDYYLKTAWEVPLQSSIFAPHLFAHLLISNQEHIVCLENAFEQAHTRLLISSAFLDIRCLKKLESNLIKALERGVKVDLLWGYEVKDSKTAALSWLNQIKKTFAKKRGAGVLRFNEQPTQSHAKLLIYDIESEKQEYMGVIGSFNWLSNLDALGEERLYNISLKTKHIGLIAQLCRCAASFWRNAYAHHLSEAPLEWQLLASELAAYDIPTEMEDLDQNALETLTNLEPEAEQIGPYPKEVIPQYVKIRLVRDQEHEHLLRYALLNAKEHCFIFSHLVTDIAAAVRLMALQKRPEGSEKCFIALAHGEPLERTLTPKDIEKFHQFLREHHILHFFTLGLHSKLLICDDWLIITSYNFLSADPFGRSKGAREVGILLKNSKLVSQIVNIIKPYFTYKDQLVHV